MGVASKLEDVLRGLTPLVEQGMVVGFPTDTENVQGIDDLVEDIRDATMEYQVRMSNYPSPTMFNVRVRPHCKKTSTTKVVGSS